MHSHDFSFLSCASRNVVPGMAFIFYLYPQVPVRSGARCPETTRKSEKRRREHAAAAFAGLKALNSPGNEETSSSVCRGGVHLVPIMPEKKCTKKRKC